MKKIVFIPPSGIMIQQDFLLTRLFYYFKTNKIKTYVLQISEDNNHKLLDADYTINVKNKISLLNYLRKNNFDLILHRTWMHRYKFASILAEEFDNIMIYIKDWHDGTRKKQYKFVYQTGSDYTGIKKLFNGKNIILSHFTSKQISIWRKTYQIKKNNFIFFPEYCNNSLFIENNLHYNMNSIKLVYAGGIPHTSYPEDIVPAKQLFKMFKTITSLKKIYVDVVLLPKFYSNLTKNSYLYQDYLYEDKFNPYFNIRIGKELDHSLLKEYDFGFFADAYIEDESLYNMFYKYAVTSKLAFYLEAGLPILVNKKSKALSKIVRTHNIGLIYKDSDLKNLNHILKIGKTKYINLVKNVYKFREKFSYNDETMKPIMDKINER